MAVLNSDQVTQIWAGGDCERFALFAVKQVSAGDTYDFGTAFRVIMQQTWLGATVTGVASGTISGTVITAPAGITNAGAYVLIQGVAR